MFRSHISHEESASDSVDKVPDNDILKLIKAEHQYVMRLLPAFREQAAAVELDSNVDYELINGLLDFFSGPMDQQHHTREDLVYAWLRENVPSQAEALDDVESDHRQFKQKISTLRKKIDAVLLDHDVPRADIASSLREFATMQINHIRKEEAGFIPLADMMMPQQVRADLSGEDKPETKNAH